MRLEGTTFRLPPVSFVSGLKLSRPRIHPYIRMGLIKHSRAPESRCGYLFVLISVSENPHFALYAISVLLDPSLDI